MAEREGARFHTVVVSKTTNRLRLRVVRPQRSMPAQGTLPCFLYNLILDLRLYPFRMQSHGYCIDIMRTAVPHSSFYHGSIHRPSPATRS